MYWQQQSKYRESNDWVFASPHMQGRYPYWPAMLLTRTIRPAAVRAGIKKKIGWHTFRHTYSTMLVANGENVKVISLLVRVAANSGRHWQMQDRGAAKTGSLVSRCGGRSLVVKRAFPRWRLGLCQPMG
jgi:integrase